jgi:cytochrome c oxidase cbb3-type subunit I/II
MLDLTVPELDAPVAKPPKRKALQVERFYYDNNIVKLFTYATIIWGVVGMLAGLLASIQLFYPGANFDFAPTTFGRVRPVHTNAVIFAFVGNGIFMGVYYSLQRLCKAGCLVTN